MCAAISVQIRRCCNDASEYEVEWERRDVWGANTLFRADFRFRSGSPSCSDHSKPVKVPVAVALRDGLLKRTETALETKRIVPKDCPQSSERGETEGNFSAACPLGVKGSFKRYTDTSEQWTRAFYTSD